MASKKVGKKGGGGGGNITGNGGGKGAITLNPLVNNRYIDAFAQNPVLNNVESVIDSNRELKLLVIELRKERLELLTSLRRSESELQSLKLALHQQAQLQNNHLEGTLERATQQIHRMDVALQSRDEELDRLREEMRALRQSYKEATHGGHNSSIHSAVYALPAFTPPNQPLTSGGVAYSSARAVKAASDNKKLRFLQEENKRLKKQISDENKVLLERAKALTEENERLSGQEQQQNHGRSEHKRKPGAKAAPSRKSVSQGGADGGKKEVQDFSSESDSDDGTSSSGSSDD